MLTHSIYEEPLLKSKSSSAINNKSKQMKLPQLQQQQKSGWDDTPGSGIPSYDSHKDKYAGIPSQIKKFNSKQKTKYKSSSASSIARLPKKINGSSSSGNNSSSLSNLDKPINLKQSLLRQRSLHEQEMQIQLIHHEWNNQRTILETYLIRKIKSRELILTELKTLINSYIDPVNNDNNTNYMNSNSSSEYLSLNSDSSSAAMINNSNNNTQSPSINSREIVDLLNILRIQSLEIIEGVQEWKHHFLSLMPSFPTHHLPLPSITATSSSSSITNSNYPFSSNAVNNNNNNNIMNPTASVLPSFQYQNKNYLMQLATDLDFLETFEQQFHIFGFDFLHNPLAYPAGGSIITMFNQRFDTNNGGSNNNGNNSNSNTMDNNSDSSNILYGNNGMTTNNNSYSSNNSSNNSNKKNYLFIDGIDYTRLQEAEKVIQWEYDIIMNPDLASQAQLQHEYFLRHGYNPNGTVDYFFK